MPSSLAARGIVDKHQQSAVFAAPLKPVVRGAVESSSARPVSYGGNYRMNAYFGVFPGFPKSRLWVLQALNLLTQGTFLFGRKGTLLLGAETSTSHLVFF